MKGEIEVTGPEIGLTMATRAALGAGLGLLLAGRLSDEARRAVGWTLLLTGAVVGGIMAAEIFGRPRRMHMSFGRRDDHAAEHDHLLRREAVRAGD